MLCLDKMLIVIDSDSDSEQDKQLSLQRALQLEQVADSRLHLVSSEFTPYLERGFYFDDFQLESLKNSYISRVWEKLNTMAGPLIEQGLAVDCDVVWGNPPYEELVRKIVQLRPDLVVYSSRYHPKLSRLLFSNQDWQLMRSCPLPLLIARERQWSPSGTIIAAVDPTHIHDNPLGLDYEILQSAQYLADKWGAELHVFHSIDDSGGTLDDQAYIRDKHQEKLSQLLRVFPVAADRVHSVEESVEKFLPALVKQLNANVVVMGVVSRGRVIDAFIGNTAEKVIDKLDCDVLVIKPEGFRTPVKDLPLQQA